MAAILPTPFVTPDSGQTLAANIISFGPLEIIQSPFQPPTSGYQLDWTRRAKDALRNSLHAVEDTPASVLLEIGAHIASKIYSNDRAVERLENGMWRLTEPEGIIVYPSLHPHAILIKELSALMFAEYKPDENDVVVIVGAGAGVDTLVASKALGRNGHVIAVEPHPKSFEALELTCFENGLSNVSLLQFCIGSEVGETIISNGASYVSNHEFVSSEESRNDGIKVPTLTLQDLVERFSPDRGIDLLVMNIEGGEREVVRYSANALAMTRHVCISYHDFRAKGDEFDPGSSSEYFRTFKSVAEDLHAAGFELQTFSPRISDSAAKCYIFGKNRQYLV